MCLFLSSSLVLSVLEVRGHLSPRLASQEARVALIVYLASIRHSDQGTGNLGGAGKHNSKFRRHELHAPLLTRNLPLHFSQVARERPHFDFWLSHCLFSQTGLVTGVVISLLPQPLTRLCCEIRLFQIKLSEVLT